MKVLLVEDDLTIIYGLEYTFHSHGYEIVSMTSINDTRKYLNKQKVDVLLLDISLPDGNGLEFYEKEFSKMQIPTIFLTAVDEEDSVVKGLELGADDYITKPFSTKELVARVNRVLIRNKKENILSVGDISFDMDKMIVKKMDEIITLTSLELKMLHLLFINLNKTVSRNYILDKIWEWTGNDVNDHTITVYMKRIREKLGSDIIITVKGIGYRIDKDET